MIMNKKFIPLIAASSVLVLAIIANIITANVNVYDLPLISRKDIPSTNDAESLYAAAQQRLEATSAELSEAESRLEEKKKEVGGIQERVDALNASIEKLKEQNAGIEELAERYEKCLAEADRLNSDWSVYSNMKLGNIDANYDVNNLRANQKNSNIYSAIGNYTGFFGKLLSDSLDTSIYNGFDKIIAAVNLMTNTVNEHIYNADALISKIKTKISNTKAIMSEDLAGEQLLFEIELFESVYFGNDDLFEEERKQLVYELNYAKVIVDAVYPIYEMMLSDSSDNSQFLIRLKNKSITAENYLNLICRSESELLTKEQISVIVRDAYKLFPMIADVITDRTYLYKDVVTTGPIYANPYKVYYVRKTYKNIFILMQYNAGASTPVNSYYYTPQGSLIYAESNGSVVCMMNGEAVYSSNEQRTDSIISAAESAYKKHAL